MPERTSKKTLNRNQAEAVQHKDGPLLIIAGAGTGKTTVVTERIKHLIFSEAAKPSEILALTFTEKAAREMEERVDVDMPYGYTQMWISTFHSFCDRILRAEALHVGLNPRYKLMTEAESVQLVRKNLFDFKLNYFRPVGNPNKFISGMLQHFSRLQDEDVIPSEYAKWVEIQKGKIKNPTDEEKQEMAKWEELSGAYKIYEEIKAREGVMDFGDLITKTLYLFRQRPNVLAQYQKQFKYILVDEFQDTNFAQNQLAILLAGEAKNITVCGDDDQSVYRFRGAAVSNIIQFRTTYPNAKVVVLNENYRSTQTVLDKSYDLICHNNPDRLEVVENIDKKLISHKKGKGDEIKFIHADRVENEAEQVVREIKRLKEEKNYSWGDFAILVRANNHAEPFTRALSRHGIANQFLGPGRLFKQSEIIDLISYLKVLYNFEDSVAFYRLLSMEYFDISPRDLAGIGNYAKKKNLSLFEACENLDDIFISEVTREKIKKLMDVIYKHLKLTRKESGGQLLYLFLEETGLLSQLLSPDNPYAEKRAANISKFFDKLRSYEAEHEEAGVTAIVDWIELASELGESPLASNMDWGETDAVNILTVHSAKGLEFPVVFLVNLVGQRFPTSERREAIPIPDGLIKEVLPAGDYHVEEERRLFYVGMTRAKDVLVLTASDYYGEGKREKKLSPFIFEALGEGIRSSDVVGEETKQLSFLDYSESVTEPALASLAQSIRPKLQVDYLSYSQIQTFDICPLHYKLRYLLKVPTPTSPSQSLGISVHAAFKTFYERVIAKEKVTREMMIEVLTQEWKSEGYLSKSHEMAAFEKASRLMLKYLEEQFDPKNLPVAMEKMFNVPLRKESPSPSWLKIGGKIDRVDLVPTGIEIIDYKTGERVPSQKDVDKDLQLTFYALAAVNLKEPPFDRKPEEITLSLYYLDEGRKLTTVRTGKQLEKEIKKIFEWKEKIESSDFTCSGNMLCNNCEFNLMCRSSQPVAEVPLIEVAKEKLTPHLIK